MELCNLKMCLARLLLYANVKLVCSFIVYHLGIEAIGSCMIYVAKKSIITGLLM